MRLSDRRFAVLLAAPAAVFLAVFVLWPLIRLVFDSFFEISLIGVGTREFVGLDNYAAALSSAAFPSAAGRTLLYTALVISLELILGFAAALLFTLLGQRSAVFRTIFLYPLMIAPVVAGLLWRFLLIDNTGVVNYLLAQFGVIPSADSIGWLSDPSIVLWAVAIPDVWLTTSFMTLIIFAGFQNIPAELIEAARLDGAGFFALLRRIVIPLLRPVIGVALLIRGIDAAKAFDIILIQTGGGPENASQTLSMLVYQTMVRYGDPGLASAMGTLYLIAMAIVAGLAIKFIWRPGATS